LPRPQRVIIRVLNMRVQPGHVGQFNALMRRLIDELRGQRGLEYVKLARRLEADGGQEVILFEEWRDPDSMYAWVGHDLTRPRLPVGARGVISALTVGHYEALDIPGPAEPPEDVERPAPRRRRGRRGSDDRRAFVDRAEVELRVIRDPDGDLLEQGALDVRDREHLAGEQLVEDDGWLRDRGTAFAEVVEHRVDRLQGREIGAHDDDDV